jgi:hypothetical protein
MRHLARRTVFFAISGFTFGQVKIQRQPVIDVHMHSQSLPDFEHYGPNPVTGEKPLESVEAHIKQTPSIRAKWCRTAAPRGLMVNLQVIGGGT